MDRHGYQSLEEIRGIALSPITTVEKLAELPPLFADIDADACTDCGLCERICFFRAIHPADGYRVVDKADCDGCGLCVQWCPVNAIELK